MTHQGGVLEARLIDRIRVKQCRVRGFGCVARIERTNGERRSGMHAR
jgi:hypothetical protein